MAGCSTPEGLHIPRRASPALVQIVQPLRGWFISGRSPGVRFATPGYILLNPFGV